MTLEQPESSVPKAVLKQKVLQFIVIDFDRTLGNSKAIMSRLYGLAEAFGINTEHIFVQQKQIENKGRSFDPLPFIREALGNEGDTMKEFKKRFVESKLPPIIYDDVNPFLKKLNQNTMQYGVLTYGVSKEWQEWKIAASGYSGKSITIDHEDKGAEVANWQTAEGTYEINVEGHESIFASCVCVIDDKKKAFRSLPETSTGYWLQRPDATESSKSGELPLNRNIKEIHSLEELSVNNGKLIIKNE